MIVLFDKESIKVEVEERQVVIVAPAVVATKWRWFNCILDWYFQMRMERGGYGGSRV